MIRNKEYLKGDAMIPKLIIERLKNPSPYFQSLLGIVVGLIFIMCAFLAADSLKSAPQKSAPRPQISDSRLTEIKALKVQIVRLKLLLIQAGKDCPR